MSQLDSASASTPRSKVDPRITSSERKAKTDETDGHL